MNTNWSSPKTNIIAGINDLRKALASGSNARLIRLRNEDCAYPIKEKHEDEDFRNYEFRIGYLSTAEEIRNNTNMSDIEKALTLSFKTCYGTPEACAHYYATGEVSADNFKGMGVAHLVHVRDMIEYLESSGDPERAEMFRAQYFGDEQNNRHFWDFYRYKHGSPWAVKHFRRKLWVVELLGKDDPRPSVPVLVHIMNALMYPLKYVPRRSVLRMPEYTNYTFRVGDVVHGFSVEFQIPKKFSFN